MIVAGENGSLVSTIARTKARVTETELEIIQIDHDLASEVARELREIDAKIGEFVERKVAAADALKRIEMRAPQDGIIHQSVAHTIGGVIKAGETVMQIVPATELLTVEAKVGPADIDQLRIGQTAALRFSAFNMRTTPEIDGTAEVRGIEGSATPGDFVRARVVGAETYDLIAETVAEETE